MNSNKINFGSARSLLLQKIKEIKSQNFEALALEVFRFQAKYNELYHSYLRLLKVNVENIKEVHQIPFLPIRFFKSHPIQTGKWPAELIFQSSGTTGATTSKHLLHSKAWYHQIAQLGFEHFYGPVKQYCVLGLLPSYLERQNSSLVFMVNDFIRQSAYSQSGFFLNNLDLLIDTLNECDAKNIPTLLIGVSFALWELAEKKPQKLKNLIIMETGGMKGRRRELTRQELHHLFKDAFAVESIHSEYGMTELLSQAYSKGQGLFFPSPTMKVFCREITDPFAIQSFGKTGAINIVDLANIDTISFIATDDLGKVYEDGGFEILGRLDHSDLRGCNLLIEVV